ncbi:hypothetical protein D3C85_1281080 [compost metagenome]
MLGARFDLGTCGVGGGEDDLALQVRQGDRVVVDQAERPDPGGGQIEGGGRADAAQADDQDTGALQGLLARPADLGQHQLTSVAVDLLVGEANGRGGSRRLGHDTLSSAVRRSRQAGTGRAPAAVARSASARPGLS